MTGAGISTSSGIPDFRTPGSGLYDNLKQYDIPYPEAIFDIDFFSWNPKPFFCLAKSLYPGTYKPNDIHYFLRLLHEKSLLLRIYTQNIDGLEQAAGIPSQRLVEAHGTFSTASCSLCNSSHPSEKAKISGQNSRWWAATLNDEIPRWETCLGVVKADIVFFGESLPKSFSSYRKDFKQSDLLIVMGTSLETEPFASIVNSVQPHLPRLLLNWDPVGPFKQTPLKHTDVRKLGDLSNSVRLLVQLLGWITDLDKLLKVQTHKMMGVCGKRETGAPTGNRTDPGPMVPGYPALNKRRIRSLVYHQVASKFYMGPGIKAQGQNCDASKSSPIDCTDHSCIESSSEENSPASEPSEL
ncbi:NAD-dependent protein deacetylase sirtuin-3 [Carcharodon carcharias]|uniref:NAD-dependent protein deacetylase sirtuin-3 n=1 Tax=Carcharodon carcharias TaxID=13397 RepID=UPI001B7DD44E|nr:NAD-dependent protein deacetylase sirtuin-3 [Carcharodon carcharias]